MRQASSGSPPLHLETGSHRIGAGVLADPSNIALIAQVEAAVIGIDQIFQGGGITDAGHAQQAEVLLGDARIVVVVNHHQMVRRPRLGRDRLQRLGQFVGTPVRRRDAATGLMTAAVVDPWGTVLELTEGLRK